MLTSIPMDLQTLTRALIFRVLATVKNSAVNSVSPILPIVELPNLGLPNT